MAFSDFRGSRSSSFHSYSDEVDMDTAVAPNFYRNSGAGSHDMYSDDMSMEPSPRQSISSTLTFSSTMSTLTNTSTESSTWSVRTPDDEEEGDYRWMDTRRYQEAIMAKPAWQISLDDSSELARFTFQHRLARVQFDGNFKAPIREILITGGKVLHIGCGNGLWILEMARDFPRAHFYGVDAMDNMFPAKKDTPPNCTFLKATLTDKLPFPDNNFEFVHRRFLNLYFRESQFVGITAELVRVTKEGGFVELMENEVYLHNAGPICHEMFNKKTRNALHANGLNPMLACRQRMMLQETHLVNVQGTYASVPTGFQGATGDFMKRHFLAEWRERKEFLMFALVMTAEELEETLEACYQELNEDQKVYLNTYVAYGRKAIQI